MKTVLGLATAALAASLWGGVVPFRADKDTDVLLGVKNGQVADLSGRVAAGKIQATGVEIVDDEVFGEVMRFTGGKKTGLTVPDEGKIGFGRGFTLEGWIFLEHEIANNFQFADKHGKRPDHKPVVTKTKDLK